VTPPSPRSLSADSDRPRHRRKRTSSNTRGRPRSGSREVQTIGAEEEANRPYTPSLPDDSSDSEPVRQGSTDSEHGKDDTTAAKQLETPESSVHRAPVTSKPTWLSGADTEYIPDSESPFYTDRHRDLDVSKDVVGPHPESDVHFTNTRAAVGILVLGVATAVVLWRVKPE